MTQATTKFEIGKSYDTRGFFYLVVKRTTCFVTLKNEFGKISRRRVYIQDGVEKVKPEGSYSMCPILDSSRDELLMGLELDNTVEEEASPVQVSHELTSVDVERVIEQYTGDLHELRNTITELGYNKADALGLFDDAAILENKLSSLMDRASELKKKEKEEAKAKKGGIRFLMYKVTDGENACKIWWYNHKRFTNEKGDLVEYISIHEKGYGQDLFKLFPHAKNGTDLMSDVIDSSSVKIYKSSPYWGDALKMAEKHKEKQRKSMEKWMEKAID